MTESNRKALRGRIAQTIESLCAEGTKPDIDDVVQHTIKNEPDLVEAATSDFVEMGVR